jgi:hypothetical protein
MSILKKSYNRLLEISDDHKQITLKDSRFYQRNGEYYPSVTYVLGCYPKGKFFEDWLKKVGYSADYIVKKAGEQGTQVHDLCERYLKGEEIKYFAEFSTPLYEPLVWEMFLRFVEFWETFKPTLIETEVFLFTDKMKVAGTCDLVVEINGERWILDIKTSNTIASTYELQTAIYKEMYEECYGKEIHRTGILWLKSSKRGPRKDKFQGKGWEIIESKRSFEDNIEIYKCVKKLFDIENPKPEPLMKKLNTVIKQSE